MEPSPSKLTAAAAITRATTAATPHGHAKIYDIFVQIDDFRDTLLVAQFLAVDGKFLLFRRERVRFLQHFLQVLDARLGWGFDVDQVLRRENSYEHHGRRMQKQNQKQ